MMEKYGYTEAEQDVVDTKQGVVATKQTKQDNLPNNTKETGEPKKDVHVKHT